MIPSPSKSATATRCPSRANEIPRSTATFPLPCPASAPTTRRLRGSSEPAASASRAASRRYEASCPARTAGAAKNDPARGLAFRVPSTGRPPASRSSSALTLGVRASARRANATPANSPAKAPNSSSRAGRGRMRVADLAGSTTSTRGSEACRTPAVAVFGCVDTYCRNPAATAFASAIASDAFRASTSIVTIRVPWSDAPRTSSRSSARETSCFAWRSAYLSTGVLFTSSA